MDIQPTRTTLTKTEATSNSGMVATKDRHATEAGLEVLELGGNAVDAAVAACFAIGVVEPASSGIGGGGYLVYQIKDRGGVIGFPMRGPIAAKPDMYELTGQPAGGIFGWAEVVGNENLEGPRSICTPGTVAGLCEAQRLHGRLPLADVMRPAIRLAGEGFPPGWYAVQALGGQAGKLHRYDELRRIFMPDGDLPASGIEPGTMVQSDLADTLETIAREGPNAFYKGEIGKAVVDGISEVGGILTRRDLESYRPYVWESGLEFSYRGHTVRVPPFACAGPTSAMTLRTVEGFDLASMGHNSTEMLHSYVSSTRLAYADRFAYMADPELHDVPWNGLVSDAYLSRRRASIGDRADRFDAGDPWVEEGRRPLRSLPASLSGWDYGTTHLCTMDGDGGAVSLTNTLGGGFGSGIVPKGTGVVVNNGMMWFDTIPGRTNSIEPGKLPLNNMTPALVLDADGVLLAVGASGGRRITNCVTQLIVKTLDFGMGPQEAIDSPRVDCSMPETYVDPRLDETVRNELESLGHKLKVVDDGGLESGFPTFASPVAILRDGTNGLRAGVDVFHSAYAGGP